MPLTLDPKDKPILLHTVRESVVNYLRGLILSGQLKQGEKLVQDEIAEHLGVSRTPVREALQKLASEGLITLSSYKGASVADFSPQQLKEIYSVRIALESHAAYLAAGRVTEDEIRGLESLLKEIEDAFQRGDFVELLAVHHRFHVGVCAASGEERLCSLAVQQLDLTDVYQRMALSLGRGATDPVVEHVEILKALREHNAEKSARLIRRHLEVTVAELLELFHQDGKV